MFASISLLVGLGFAGLLVIVAFMFRRVVEPNEVHIVQSSRGTTAYGLSETEVTEDGGAVPTTKSLNGNSYYEWPSFLPLIGCQVTVLPLSVFDLELTNYEAYDIGKVPFVVDVVAFFRITNPSIAAKRISSQGELQQQLTSILQGAVRTILAKHDVEAIMMERSTYGQLFTAETADQLTAWGVENVKNIELMDIRDGRDSKTISNIMAKKESFIDMESRQEVAKNQKEAQVAEIAANQEVAVRDQKAQELVGLRTAEKDQNVGIADEKALQEIKTQAKETMTREMAVKEVETVRTAQIIKEQQLVAAAQERETRVIKAEGEKQVTVTVAEGNLAEKEREAEGILAVGTSEAEAKRLAEMATVSPQIALATEIGENEGYQTYLISIRGVEKDEAVGIEQAKALVAAEIKVIANTGHVNTGVSNVMDLFSSKGGTALAGAVEALAQSEKGQAVLEAAGVETDQTNGLSV
jgi:flotillin